MVRFDQISTKLTFIIKVLNNSFFLPYFMSAK